MLVNALHGKETILEFGNWLRLLRITNFFFGNERHTLLGIFKTFLRDYLVSFLDDFSKLLYLSPQKKS